MHEGHTLCLVWLLLLIPLVRACVRACAMFMRLFLMFTPITGLSACNTPQSVESSKFLYERLNDDVAVYYMQWRAKWRMQDFLSSVDFDGWFHSPFASFCRNKWEYTIVTRDSRTGTVPPAPVPRASWRCLLSTCFRFFRPIALLHVYRYCHRVNEQGICLSASPVYIVVQVYLSVYACPGMHLYRYLRIHHLLSSSVMETAATVVYSLN